MGGGPTPDVSGEIRIEARTRVDGDTADDIVRGQADRSNNNVNTPQGLPSPAIVGGYVSAVSGPHNDNPSLRYPEDPVDRMELGLTDSQVVSVQLFAASDGLASGSVTLVGPDGVLEDSAVLTEQNDSVSVSPTDSGDAQYRLDIEAESASHPFRYVVSVSSSSGSGGATHLSANDASFVPGEALVTYASPMGDVQGMALQAGASRTESLGGNAWLLHQADQFRAFSRGSVSDRQQTLDWIRELRQRPGIVTAEPNYRVHGMQVNPDNDTFYDSQWNFPLIRVPSVWQVQQDPGLGTRIAVLDTGLFSSQPSTIGDWHPDIAASGGNNRILLPGSITPDYVSGANEGDGTGGRDDNPANPGNDSNQAANFHGTHVSGIAVGRDNERGVVGLAPMADLLPIRVLGDDEQGNTADLIDAINDLAALDESVRPDVINLSLGGVGNSSTLRSAIDNAVDQGVLFVAAAGNQGMSDPVYPAAFDNVVAVGAVDAAGRRAGYSNFGDWLDLVAPGGDASRDGNSDGQADVITSTWGRQTGDTFTPDYARLQGTSMAAPHVSGVIALMQQASQAAGQGDVTTAEFMQRLREGRLTRKNDDFYNENEYGQGLIDAVKATEAAGLAFNGVIVANPASFRFNGSVTTSETTLSVLPESDSEAVLPTASASSPSWLDVSKEESLDGETVTLVATINNRGQAEQDEVTVSYEDTESNSRTLNIPVNVQLGDPVNARDAGRHYVLLVSTDGERDTVAQQVVTASEGSYAFAFDDVEPGEYFLVAGSDVDNDGHICDNGEACAEYPTNGLPEPIRLGDTPRNNLTMTTSFRRSALSAESLPRPGFRGYRLLRPESAEPQRKVVP